MTYTILLVEDNELNRDMLSRRLERKGYEIKMAVDGAQGVSMATELRPALILMDLSLPVMDGWEAIRRIKGNPETATIPIIALTAHARAEDEKTARDAGANDFDTKPVDLNRLVGKMEHLLTPNANPTLPESQQSSQP
jgi:two-component system response regulator